jgi:hypothetical protein
MEEEKRGETFRKWWGEKGTKEIALVVLRNHSPSAPLAFWAKHDKGIKNFATSWQKGEKRREASWQKGKRCGRENGRKIQAHHTNIPPLFANACVNVGYAYFFFPMTSPSFFLLLKRIPL